MFYFKIRFEWDNKLTADFSFDSDSSSEAKKEKQKLYDLFNEIFDGGGDGFAFLLKAMETVRCSTITVTIKKHATASLSPIETNVKLLNGYSDFWENGAIVEKVESVLLAKIKKDMSVVFDITPRDFEKVVAESYYALGFDVELTPVVKDGGKDIIVVGNDENGQQFIHFIECKRHSAGSPVGVSIVRGFESVVRRETANLGIIVTTAYFTKNAKEEKEKYYNGVIEFEEFHKLIERIR